MAINDEHLFSVLGINELEERAYRWLLEHSGATAMEVARALKLTAGKAVLLLGSIEDKGLASHTPERPSRYSAIPPDISIEALILQNQNDLQRAKRAARKLQQQIASSQRADERQQMVELIANREVENQILDQMQRMAQKEVMVLTRAPMRIPGSGISHEQQRATQREVQKRGVRYRNIVDADYLGLAGTVQRLKNDMKLGEQIRVRPYLSLKMFMVDRRSAVIPLNLQQPSGPSLLIRSSPLLDALHSLFEILWERAVPIAFAAAGGLTKEAPASVLSPDARDLIMLLASGLNDKTIAGELNVSSATLNRRIVRIMKALGTRTRFQAGWQARGMALEENGIADRNDPPG